MTLATAQHSGQEHSKRFPRSRHFREWVRFTLDIVYPPVCRGCGQALLDDREQICRDCWHVVHYLNGPICEQCGVPRHTLQPDEVCNYCLPNWPEGVILRSAVAYNGPLPLLIQGLKFNGYIDLAIPLGQWLHWGFERHYRDHPFDLFVPVPLHPRRERIREYNQSRLLADFLSTHCGVPVQPHILKRWRHTVPQTSLKGSARRRNVTGAFRVENPDSIRGKRILVVDDVATTGSTIGEATRALLDAGARQVSALTVARAIPSVLGKES